MHNNYHFLQHVSTQLNKQLTGFSFSEAFSQDKDEVIFIFEKDTQRFVIQAHLKGSFSCLNFPNDFSKARRNVATLFPELENVKVLAVKQIAWERAFLAEFEQGFSLLFKLFGNKSNILLFENGELQRVFKNSLRADHAFDFTQFNQAKVLTEAHFLELGAKAIPTFDAKMWDSLGLDKNAASAQLWPKVQAAVAQLEQHHFYVSFTEPCVLSMFKPETDEYKTFDNAIEAVNFFFRNYLSQTSFITEKQRYVQILEKKIFRLAEYLQVQNKKLFELENHSKNKQIADILMANLHQVYEGSSEVTLFDFYENKDIIIKLKSNISPQKNAEYYYQKSKKEYLEVENLQKSIDSFSQEKLKLDQLLEQIVFCESYKELQKIAKPNIVFLKAKAPELESPFRTETCMGYQILIGRNAQNNDLLTTQYAKKNDLWLHAKDVSGSHVVIKHIPGANIPKPVIHRAAELAAFHSKRRNDSLTPVTLTPKKYVRKTKHLAAGAVIVDREEVLLVVPKA
jgi:predicted ribosome quality control (RQC) complex YloA/Tae2 family protein